MEYYIPKTNPKYSSLVRHCYFIKEYSEKEMFLNIPYEYKLVKNGLYIKGNIDEAMKEFIFNNKYVDYLNIGNSFRKFYLAE
jgi:hypothetical protein